MLVTDFWHYLSRRDQAQNQIGTSIADVGITTIHQTVIQQITTIRNHMFLTPQFAIVSTDPDRTMPISNTDTGIKQSCKPSLKVCPFRIFGFHGTGLVSVPEKPPWNGRSNSGSCTVSPPYDSPEPTLRLYVYCWPAELLWRTLGLYISGGHF